MKLCFPCHHTVNKVPDITVNPYLSVAPPYLVCWNRKMRMELVLRPRKWTEPYCDCKVGISFLLSLDTVSEVCVYNALLPADCVFALSDQLLTNHTLNLWLDTFDCKIIAQVAQWEATSLQTTVVRLGKTGIGIRRAGTGLQVTTV